jgi:hypothetical protein
MLAVANNRQGHNITLPGDRAKSEFCTSLFQAKRGLLKNATGMREEKERWPGLTYGIFSQGGDRCAVLSLRTSSYPGLILM